MIELQITEIALPASGAGFDSIVAVAGILGTLGGAALGALVTWKIQRHQVEHEDRTRFHDRRVSSCAEFNAACNHIVGSLNGGQPVPLDHLQAFMRSWETLRLMSSIPVVLAGSVVFADVMMVIRKEVTNVDSFNTAYNAHMISLVDAVRREIGADSFFVTTADSASGGR